MSDYGFLKFLKIACWTIGICTILGMILYPFYHTGHESLAQYMAKPVTMGDLWFVAFVIVLLSDKK